MHAKHKLYWAFTHMITWHITQSHQLDFCISAIASADHKHWIWGGNNGLLILRWWSSALNSICKYCATNYWKHTHREHFASKVFLSGPGNELLGSYNIRVVKPQVSQTTLQQSRTYYWPQTRCSPHKAVGVKQSWYAAKLQIQHIKTPEFQLLQPSLH